MNSCLLLVDEAKNVTDLFRNWHGIVDPIYFAGNCSVYWRASSQLSPDELRLDMYEEHVQKGRTPLGVDVYRVNTGKPLSLT